MGTWRFVTASKVLITSRVEVMGSWKVKVGDANVFLFFEDGAVL